MGQKSGYLTIQVGTQALVPEEYGSALMHDGRDQVTRVPGQEVQTAGKGREETGVPVQFQEAAAFGGQDEALQLLFGQTQTLRLQVQQEAVDVHVLLLRTGSPEAKGPLFEATP